MCIVRGRTRNQMSASNPHDTNEETLQKMKQKHKINLIIKTTQTVQYEQK